MEREIAGIALMIAALCGAVQTRAEVSAFRKTCGLTALPIMAITT
jgi:hypothetical protein